MTEGRRCWGKCAHNSYIADSCKAINDPGSPGDDWANPAHTTTTSLVKHVSEASWGHPCHTGVTSGCGSLSEIGESLQGRGFRQPRTSHPRRIKTALIP